MTTIEYGKGAILEPRSLFIKHPRQAPLSYLNTKIGKPKPYYMYRKQ